MGKGLFTRNTHNGVGGVNNHGEREQTIGRKESLAEMFE